MTLRYGVLTGRMKRSQIVRLSAAFAGALATIIAVSYLASEEVCCKCWSIGICIGALCVCDNYFNRFQQG